MTQSARTRTWQRVMDCTIGAVIAALGIIEICRFIQQPIHHEASGLVWALLLTGAGLAVIIGAALRTVRAGTRQSVGFGFELAGWGGSACLVGWYAVIGYQHDHDLAMLGALTLIFLTLSATFGRLVAAMREGIRRIRVSR